MGTWGIGAFENDDAMDWLADATDGYARTPPRAAIAAAFAAACVEGYLERDAGAAAIAAAEFVAASRGMPRPCEAGGELAPVAVLLAAAAAEPNADLAVEAARALACACDERRSEIAQLWAEAASLDFATWLESCEDLRVRLGGSARDALKI